MTSKHIILATGGTGGHIFPAEAVAQKLAAEGYQLSLFTDKRARHFDGALANINSYEISSAGIAGRGVMRRIIAVLKLVIGLMQAIYYLMKIRPQLIIGFGGYSSVPSALAAKFLGIKLIIHEQNAVLGRANRLLAPLADKIALSFPKTSLMRPKDRHKTKWTGNPVRMDIADLYHAPYHGLSKSNGTENQIFHILITGGSQGASVFSTILPDALALLDDDIKANIRVVQQVRPHDEKSLIAIYKKYHIDCEIKSFFDDMPQRLQQAHLVIARAGASTIAELAVAKRPAILVPYPHAIDDHQSANAAILSDMAGAWTIPQGNFSPSWLCDRLTNFYRQPLILERASQASAKFAKYDAADALCKLVTNLIDSK